MRWATHCGKIARNYLVDPIQAARCYNRQPGKSSLCCAGSSVMSHYRVSFFKNLLSSNGHPFKCLQQRSDVPDSEDPAQAAEAASRKFETLYGVRDWELYADSIEVEIADHS